MKTRVLSFASLNHPLVRNQTQALLDRLQQAAKGLDCHLNIVSSPVRKKTRQNEAFLATSSGEVEFLEQMVLGGEARLVVLEADDITLPLPEGLEILCVPDRGTPFDAFLNSEGHLMDEMDPGGTVGVLSLRARSRLSALWPDLKFKILQGGVDLAMEAHMQHSGIDGLVLPAAVTEHLGIQGIVAEIFSPEFVLPGPGQGLLVVIGRRDDGEARELLRPIHSAASEAELKAELAFRSRMVTDQDLPVSALARVDQSQLVISGTTGSGIKRMEAFGPVEKAEAIGNQLANQILSCIDTFADLLEADLSDDLDVDDDPDREDLLDDLDLPADADEDWAEPDATD